MNTQVRVYKYGISAVLDNREQIIEQMFLSNRYRNKLIEIELERRAAREAAQEPYLRPGLDSELEELTNSIDAIVQSIRKENSSARKKIGGCAADKEALKTLKTRRKNLTSERRKALKEIGEREDLKPVLEEINKQANTKTKQARAECGVYWGTYLLSEASVKAASKERHPKFKRWEGSGLIAVQIQASKPLSTIEVFGNDSRIRVAPVDSSAWDSDATRGERRRKCRTEISIRIGSVGRDPIWAKFRMHMHRPLPVGEVKWVKISREMIGPRERWFAHFVVKESSVPKSPPPGVCAVDLGWRKAPGGVQVATLLDHKGNVDQLVLDDRFYTSLEVVAGLQGVREKAFNQAREILTERLASLEAPEWFLEHVKTLSLWKSEGRLAGLCRRWSQNRFPGDSEAYQELEQWRYHDFHLWTWQASQRKKSLLRRKEIFRCWASKVSQSYGTIILRKLDLKTLGRKKAAEDDLGEDTYLNKYRKNSAVGYLAADIEQAGDKNGCSIILADTNLLKHRCSNCSHVNEDWDLSINLEHRCSNCDECLDCSVNAAANMFKDNGYSVPEMRCSKNNVKTEYLCGLK